MKKMGLFKLVLVLTTLLTASACSNKTVEKDISMLSTQNLEEIYLGSVHTSE